MCIYIKSIPSCYLGHAQIITSKLRWKLSWVSDKYLQRRLCTCWRLTEKILTSELLYQTCVKFFFFTCTSHVLRRRHRFRQEAACLPCRKTSFSLRNDQYSLLPSSRQPLSVCAFIAGWIYSGFNEFHWCWFVRVIRFLLINDVCSACWYPPVGHRPVCSFPVSMCTRVSYV